MTVDLNMMLDLRDLQVAMDVAKRAEMGWFDVEFTMYGTCFERCGKRYFRVSADAARIYDFIETSAQKGAPAHQRAHPHQNLPRAHRHARIHRQRRQKNAR